MNKALSIFAAISCVGLSQLSHAQHGRLNLISTDVGEGGANVYFAGSVLMAFAPGTNDPFGSHFDAYCTVLNVDAYIGSTWGATKLDTTHFVPSPNASILPSAADARVGSEIAWLANTYGITHNTEQAAATQLAIWDLAEGGSGAAGDHFFSTEISSWSFSNNVIGDSRTYAADAISAYGHGTRAVDTWYQADVVNNTHVSQDFVTPNPTPEPITLGLGVAGIGLAIRRRLQKSA